MSHPPPAGDGRRSSSDAFRTRHGESIPLEPDHRAGVRLPSDTGSGASDHAGGGDEAAELADLRAVGRRVRLAARTLALFGGRIAGADVLVAGASDRAEVAWCAGLGAASVIGTDHGDRFAAGAAAERVARRRARLVPLAERAAESLGLAPRGDTEPATLRFVVDELTDSARPDRSVDLLLSWQTLEHVPDVPAAMRETARLLRPGGLAYHEDNPFFALDGGHSAGTLDMPWGHVRLEPEDLERFLRTRRPDEAEDALDFLRHAINRATQADVRRAAAAAGLEVAAWLPRTRTEDLMLLEPGILAQCRRAHPAVEVVDLVSRIVRCVLRRP